MSARLLIKVFILLLCLVILSCGFNSSKQPKDVAINIEENGLVLSSADKANIEKVKQVLMNKLPYSIDLFEEGKNQNGHINYDFDGDGKIDLMEYNTFMGKDSYGYEVINKCVINIGGNVLEENYIESDIGEGISKLGLVDINIDDNYTEIFVTHGDLRGGIAVIYRFVDKKYVEIARVDGGILATSGKGEIYYWGGNLYEDSEDGEFNSSLVLSYYDINKKEVVETNQIVGKSITSDREFIVYKSQEDVIDGAPVTEEEKISMSENKIVKILKRNETFKVLSLDDGIKISTEDGAIGWIGGFHMVWD
ncbi:hypothetical protein [Cohnella endophytica]|nr:hypothetical protein [Cohnella endophytica]